MLMFIILKMKDTPSNELSRDYSELLTLPDTVIRILLIFIQLLCIWYLVKKVKYLENVNNSLYTKLSSNVC